MKDFLDAMNKLAMQCVVKLLEIDLNTVEYKVVYLDKGENTTTSPFLADWINNSCSKELIHPDYIDVFKTVTDIEHIKKVLKYKKYVHLKFKRMPYKNGDYRDTVMTILPKDEHKVYMILYDIEN